VSGHLERQWRLPVCHRIAWGRQVNVFGLTQGSARLRVEPNGTRRVAPTNTLHLRIEQTARVRARIRIGLFLDVFNVANRGVPDSAQSVPVNTMAGPRFGEPLAWTAPRTLRVGVRWFVH
jgi:hypothetical protein